MLPAYSPLNAIHLPSGEKCGFVVCPWKLVIRRAMPPERSTVQMLFAYANAICDALTVGIRSSFVGSPSAAGRPANAVRITAEDAQIASVVFMSHPPAGDGTIFRPMRTLRRVLFGSIVFALVAYGGAIVWLMTNETRLVFQSGQA